MSHSSLVRLPLFSCTDQARSLQTRINSLIVVRMSLCFHQAQKRCSTCLFQLSWPSVQAGSNRTTPQQLAGLDLLTAGTWPALDTACLRLSHDPRPWGSEIP